MLCSAPAMDCLTGDVSRSCNKFSVICLKFIFSQFNPLIHQLSATSISLNTKTIVKRLNKPLCVLIRGKTHKSEVPTLPCTEINPQTKPLNNHIRMKHAQLTCLQTSRIIMINLLITLSFLDKPRGDSQHSPSMKSAYLQETQLKDEFWTYEKKQQQKRKTKTERKASLSLQPVRMGLIKMSVCVLYV